MELITAIEFPNEKRLMMAFVRNLLVLTCGVAISACDAVEGIGEGNTPDTAIVTLSDTGEIPDQGFADDTGTGSDLTVVDGALTGYAYEYGLIEGTTTFKGVAGITPDSNPGAEITTGTVTYDGSYSLAHVEIDEVNNVNGDISLTADFGNSSVTGADGSLIVAGNFNGTTLSGTVIYDGISADLSGVVGTEALIGAFAGNTSDELVVGGIVATAE